MNYGGQFTYWDGQTLQSFDSTHEIPNMYEKEDWAFLQSIDTGIKDKNHIDFVLESARLLDALYQSSEKKTEVQL